MTSQTIIRPTAPETEAPALMKGWHRDPLGQHKLRFHDGASWSQHTTHYGPVPCQGCGR